MIVLRPDMEGELTNERTSSAANPIDGGRGRRTKGRKEGWLVPIFEFCCTFTAIHACISLSLSLWSG